MLYAAFMHLYMSLRGRACLIDLKPVTEADCGLVDKTRRFGDREHYDVSFSTHVSVSQDSAVRCCRSKEYFYRQ